MHVVIPQSSGSAKRRILSLVAAVAVCTAAVAVLPSCKKEESPTATVDATKAAADKAAAEKDAAAKASADKAVKDQAAADKASADKAAADQAAADKAAAAKASADKAAADKAIADKAAADKAAADKAAAEAHAIHNNPAYESWAKLNPGSSVTLKTTSEAAGTKTEMQTTTVLKEVTADKAVVEATLTMAGNAMAPTKTDIPKAALAAPVAAVVTPGVDTKQSDETISVAGKDYKCHVVETTTEANGAKTTSKIWTCPDVPNMMVKMESTTTGAFSTKMKMELVKIELK